MAAVIETRLMKSPIDVVSYCERWARWRARGCRSIGPHSGGTLLGKIMDGMKSTTCPDCRGEGRYHMPGGAFISPCPRCNGEGRISGALEADSEHTNTTCPQCLRPDPVTGKLKPTGEFAGVTCFVCHGTGRRVRHHMKVNPASINGTRFSGANEDPDPISAAIDNLVASWMNENDTVWLHLVVMKEYDAGGTAEMKANRLGVSGAFFSVKLKQAHECIGDMLDRMRVGKH